MELPATETGLRMRPRFELSTTLPVGEACQRLSEALERPHSPCRGLQVDNVFELMTRGEHHFWSPELRMRIEPEAAGSEVRGRFGPKPAVWTMFLVAYAHIGFLGLGGVIYGMAQWLLERPPWALLAGPGAVVAALLVYLAARLGQQLGADEMHVIARFVEEQLSLE